MLDHSGDGNPRRRLVEVLSNLGILQMGIPICILEKSDVQFANGDPAVCKLNAAPPYDIDFVPIHMKCSNPNCKLYLSHIEEDRADVLDGLCLKCFKELPEDTIRKPLREVYEPNEIRPVLNIWSGEMVTWDPFEQTDYRKTKEVN